MACSTTVLLGLFGVVGRVCVRFGGGVGVGLAQSRTDAPHALPLAQGDGLGGERGDALGEGAETVEAVCVEGCVGREICLSGREGFDRTRLPNYMVSCAPEVEDGGAGPQGRQRGGPQPDIDVLY